MNDRLASVSRKVLDAVAAEIAAAFPQAQAIYLFGSAGEDRMRSESDLDFAVLAPAAVDSFDLFTLASHLGSLAGRDVDLVDLRAAPLTLQAQVVGRGRRIATFSEERSVAFFENQVLSRYLAFVEERRPLVAEIKKRGAVYA